MKSESVWEDQIELCVGEVALIKLERAFGGTFIYMRAGTPKPELVEAIGQQAAQKLTDEYGGEDIYVPKVRLKIHRNAMIQKDAITGTSLADLSGKYNLSTKWIMKILTEQYNFGKK